MKQEIETFICGHTAVLKPNRFGRGKPRLRRIAIYFRRKCLHCAIEAVPASIATLSRLKDGTTYSGVDLDEKIIEKIAKLKRTYLETDN